MNTITTFAVLLLAGLASSSPTTINSDLLFIDDDFFPSSLSVYTAENDIIKLMTPLNALNFNEDDDDDNNDESDSVYLFFVEGDKDSEGNTIYKGLSVLKDKKATKLLENGKDAAAGSDESKKVYLGASDGIYLFNAKTNTAEKYGTVNEDIVGIEVENGTDVIYILTTGNIVYKVTEEGTVKEQINKIENAKQIALDFANNLYFVNTENQVFVYVDDEVTKIKGLPHHPSYVQLIRPPFVFEEGIPIIAGKKAFSVYPNGTSEFAEIILNVRPTAYSMEATLIHYYAHNKKIYEYNILAIILGEVIESIKSYFNDNVEQIQAIATRSRQDFRA